MNLEELFFRHLAPTSPMPYLLNIKSAKGTILKDTDGQEYFDLIAGIAVASVGHAHPRVVQAVQDQIAKHGHVMVYGEYIQESVVMLAAPPVGLKGSTGVKRVDVGHCGCPKCRPPRVERCVVE